MADDAPKIPTPRLVIGPPQVPGDIGLVPPTAMLESPAWRAHIEAARQGYHEAHRMCR